MKWQIEYTERAWKDLRRLERAIAQVIVTKIKHFASQESPLRFAKKLKHPFNGLYQFRIGEYRAIFAISGKSKIKLLIILRVRHRKDSYR